MNYIHSIHFTVEEANETLDRIKPLIEEMMNLKKKLDVKGFDIFSHRYLGGSGPNGKGAFPEEMDRLVDILKKLTADGVMVKSIDSGVVDFPHLRSSGEEVYLCWKYGESDIAYWHNIHDGFSGRRILNEL